MWDAETGRLVWADIAAGLAHLAAPIGPAAKHRDRASCWRGPPGCRGGLLVAVQQGFATLDDTYGISDLPPTATRTVPSTQFVQRPWIESRAIASGLP